MPSWMEGIVKEYVGVGRRCFLCAGVVFSSVFWTLWESMLIDGVDGLHALAIAYKGEVFLMIAY